MSNINHEAAHLLIFSVGRSLGAVLSNCVDDVINASIFGNIDALIRENKREYKYNGYSLRLSLLANDLNSDTLPMLYKPKIIIPKIPPGKHSNVLRRGYIISDPESIDEIPLSQIHPLPDLIMAALNVQMIWGVAEIEDQLVLIMDLPPLEE